MPRLAVVRETALPDLAAAVDDLAGHLAPAGFPPADLPDADLVLVVADAAQPVAGLVARLVGESRKVLLLGPTLGVLAGARTPGVATSAGVVTGATTPVHPVRVRPGPDAGELAARWDGDLVVTDRWLQLDKVADDVEVLATAMSGLASYPVLTWRPATGTGALTLGSRPAVLRDPGFRRLVHRALRRAAGVADAAPVRVGMLGFGAIGLEHAEAIAAVDGLELAAVCDRNAGRLAAARAAAPDAAVRADADALLADAGVDLVVVSTPPNTHAEWALRAMAAGKHVVVEKPFSITTAEADEMVQAAEGTGRTLAVYQNRRWDPDYLALKRVVRAGDIGEVFHYESFVGGYSHPCNYWHSDEEVSGGAIYDWGSHFLDWVLDLLPQNVLHVTAATHKRRWHDVTNADHSRLTIRFADGVEAEFVHSDLAAAMKPKWYVLGTEGAVVGHWREERLVARTGIGTLAEERFAPADAPAALTVHAADGSVTSLAVPPAPRHPFHRELADRLLSGLPMSVTPAGSRRTVAVMEAAVTSAREDGRPVVPA